MKSFTAEFKQYGVDWSRVPVAQQQKLYDFFETHMYQHPYLVARATHATIVRGMKPSDFPVQPCCCLSVATTEATGLEALEEESRRRGWGPTK